MRAIFGFSLLLSFGSILTASPVNLGTFSVTGSGSFACDVPDAVFEYSFSFSGSNSNYTITAGSTGLGGSNPGSNLQFPSCGSYLGENAVLADNYPPSFDSIEPIAIMVAAAVPNTYLAGTFEVGNGTGYLNIFDNASAQPGNPANLIATAALIGYVTVDSVQTTEPFYPSWSGTFQITGAPEPASGILILVAALALRVWKRYSAFARG
jgi:hypothetical protein